MTKTAFFCAIIASLAALLSGGCKKKVSPGDAARQFVQQIELGHPREAYESSAFAFQAQQTLASFERTSREMGLTDLAKTVFSETRIEDDTARITADFQTKDGRSFALNMVLIEETGAWRVFSIKSPRSLETGLVENKFSVVGKGTSFVDPVNRQAVPDEQFIRKMTLKTMLDFNAALRKKSFDGFHGNLAIAWRKQISDTQLQRAFQPFIDKDIDVSGIKDVEFIFDQKPDVNSDGLLIVSGHYPTNPYEVLVELKYMYEVPRWRLFGIDVKLTK
ncbi:MAG: hypothetical protein ABI680_08100 [Chthoniobacteraceae bacterium]